jgi:hypothetical protein
MSEGMTMSKWQSIETAPKDGTPIQARIPGNGSDNIIAWCSDLLDSEGQFCGGWSFAEDQEPPDDWTDGICWAVNEDGNPSTQPTHWAPLPGAERE